MTNIITNVSITEDVAFITINNIPNTIKMLADIFGLIAGQSINIDMISQTAPYKDKINISFSVSQDDLGKIIDISGELKKLASDISTEINGNNTKFVFSGTAMKTECGVAAQLFKLFFDNDIAIKLITTSETEISCLIDVKDKEKVKKMF